jgi:hypothetical protein
LSVVAWNVSEASPSNATSHEDQTNVNSDTKAPSMKTDIETGPAFANGSSSIDFLECV